MDLSKLDTVTASNDGAVCKITTADGEPTDVEITMLGPDSDKVQRLSRAMQDRAVNRSRRTKKIDTEELTAQSIDLLAKATVGWQGLEEKGGDGKLAPLPFSYENAVRIYTDYPLIKEQVQRFIGDRVNFIKG